MGVAKQRAESGSTRAVGWPLTFALALATCVGSERCESVDNSFSPRWTAGDCSSISQFLISLHPPRESSWSAFSGARDTTTAVRLYSALSHAPVNIAVLPRHATCPKQ